MSSIKVEEEWNIPENPFDENVEVIHGAGEDGVSRFRK